MTGFRTHLELDDADLQRMFSGLLSMGQNLAPVLDEIGAYVEMSTKERFESNIAPDGTPWTPSHRAQAEGGRTLLNEGHLRDSINRAPASQDEVVVSTNLIYAAIHQTGGTIVPRSAKKLAFKTPFGMAFLDEVTLPARPFFGLSAEDNRAIPEVALDYYEEVAGGR
ncbi:phage virion morphogenesis protein [Paremcibacter congregatus]|uniref:phage virion morphogenesis protein n=1 Tax=Paremcibacter congregatus TaxID=2043170 RepID=UPI0030EB9A9C|tara:strand:+ start:1325 stop:1825 length:501 start_codon:yes stop_codon:yes gene_type:complete